MYYWEPWSKDQRLSETLFYMCAVAQHVEDTPGQNRQAPTTVNDVAVLQNEQVAYV